MFPVSMNGTVRAKPAEVLDTVLLQSVICDDLRRQQIACESDASEIRFVNRSFSVFTLTRYSVVERGSFIVKPNGIDYRLSTKVLTLVGSLLAILFGLFFVGLQNQSVADWLLVPVGTWILLVGANYAMTWYRNYIFLRRLVTNG